MNGNQFFFGGLPPSFDCATDKDNKMPHERVNVHCITNLPQYVDNEKSQQITPEMLCWEAFQQQNGYVLTNEELHQVDVKPSGPFVSPLLAEFSQYNRINTPMSSSFSSQPMRNSIGFAGMGR
ncbi:hypothetical protein XU18_1905 [Perkinsela sp. CCAP 1560/4]|nr:hypothetical protein XU18_1905 [Perkinsela sp. CCAP 1560/4]|eukprot:KNH07373.1 hypothetical protein XU18_1905 [Perkinsela sp. CCAP 1560/4]